MDKIEKKRRKEILYDIFERFYLLEDSFEPYIEKELKYLKEKYNLKAIDVEYKIKWKLKDVKYN